MAARRVEWEIRTVMGGGREIPILYVKKVKGEDAVNNQCRLCGLKVRGEHAYIMQMFNGDAGDEGDGAFFLPTDDFWDDYNLSRGGTAVGAECRKQLPQEYVLQVKGWRNT
jgi:hypothetical protein